nr:helix-turn-helix transcriptional regulator [Flexivirga oryzae]
MTVALPNVRTLRERTGLSQEAFADRIGMHRTYWSAIERGEKNLTLKSVERIAEYFEREAVELLR